MRSSHERYPIASDPAYSPRIEKTDGTESGDAAEDFPLTADWPLLQSRDFKHDPDDPGKKERYQAEALLWKHVPLEALQGVCCYSRTVEERIQAEVEQRSLALKVGSQPSWYF